MNKKFHLIFLVATALLLFISQLILNNFKVEIDTLTYYLRGMLLIVTVEAILLGRNSVNKKSDLFIIGNGNN